jgi:hypothetical protein
MAKKAIIKDELKHLIGKFHCPKCSGEDFTITSEKPYQEYAGLLPDGTRFTGIVRHHVQCSGCDQKSVLMRYEFDPAKWKD